MKEILELIETEKEKLEKLPLLQFMQDKSIKPNKRLSWAPCLAPFAMGFGDLNKYVLRQESSCNEIQRIINIHTYEDDHHWLWFLEDLKRLGMDNSLNFSDALKFMWSEETHKTRLVCHKLGLLYTFNANAKHRLAISLAIEATGHVILYWTSEITKELIKITNQHYIYFGGSHFDVETGDPVGTENVKTFIENIELSAEEKNKACELVEEVFEIFTEMFHECMEYIGTHTIDEPYAKGKKRSKILAVNK